MLACVRKDAERRAVWGLNELVYSRTSAHSTCYGSTWLDLSISPAETCTFGDSCTAVSRFNLCVQLPACSINTGCGPECNCLPVAPSRLQVPPHFIGCEKCSRSLVIAGRFLLSPSDVISGQQFALKSGPQRSLRFHLFLQLSPVDPGRPSVRLFSERQVWG